MKEAILVNIIDPELIYEIVLENPPYSIEARNPGLTTIYLILIRNSAIPAV